MTELAKQTDRLGARLDAQQLDQLLRRMHSLPSVAAVAQRVLEQVMCGCGGRLSAGQLDQMQEALRLDPAMTARLISQANQRGGKTVRTVRDAIARLGVDAIRAVILSGQVSSEPVTESGLDYDAHWKHSLATAVAAELLADKSHLSVDKEEAFVCGLLHDIGKLVLEQNFPRSYKRVLDATLKHNGNVGDYEREMIGVDHTVAGLYLARQWRLGEMLESVIWLSHQPVEAVPESIGNRDAVHLIHLADTIARDMRIGFSGNYSFGRTADQLAMQLDIPREVLDQIRSLVPRKVDEYCRKLGTQSVAGEVGVGQMISDANVELGRMNQELCQRTEVLAAQRRVIDSLNDFTSSVKPDATVFDVLERIADLIVSNAGIVPTQDEPLLAYSICRSEQSLLVLRADSRPGRLCHVLPLQDDYDTGDPTRCQASPTAAMTKLLGSPEDVADLIDLDQCCHYALLNSAQWVGGVIYQLAGQEQASGDVVAGILEPLGNVLAMCLSLAQGRSHAMTLSEQLAGSSQLLAKTQEQLAEARTLAAVGEMAAGAGHEMNNPLAVISGRAQLMRDRAKDDKDRRTWGTIAEQAQRISDIITDLMDLASPREPHLEELEVKSLLEEASREFAGGEHPKLDRTRIETQMPTGDLSVLCDRQQIQAVLVELITNAATAAKADLHIRLSAEADDVSDAVLLTVSDNGPGMAPETLTSAFTPFFSAQEAGRRRGMGLPRSQRYAINNGGRLWIKSQKGEGTTVYLQIPRARKKTPLE